MFIHRTAASYDHGGFTSSIESSQIADCFWIDPGNRATPLGSLIAQVFAKLRESKSMGLDKITVERTFGDDNVHQSEG